MCPPSQPSSGRGDAGDGAVITAVGLRKSFGEQVALSGVSLEAQRGELVACIGPNGAGKTTLLTILAGIQRPDAGEVRYVPSRVGWVPQQPALYGKLSVVENLRLFARLEGVASVTKAVDRMVAHAGLEERADEQVQRLSGGNRQRVNIAIGLLAAPPVLLLDEPTAALDPRQRGRQWDFIVGLAGDGTTVVYSTHNVSEAEQYANRVLVLADGERLFWGSPQELQATVSERSQTGDTGFEASFVSFLRERGH